jgi:uncharacterized membrane protein YoaK (UPF0700 family)
MTTWGALILIAAVFFGLRGSVNSRPKYAAAFAVVFAAVVYAAMRQHAY